MLSAHGELKSKLARFTKSARKLEEFCYKNESLHEFIAPLILIEAFIKLLNQANEEQLYVRKPKPENGSNTQL